ncbi:hypothetical protein OKF32_03600 [Lentilactobacillus buchneri]|nr:hypothetical protein OKF32_03600 [Lentilactobacillus sp. Egmn17]
MKFTKMILTMVFVCLFAIGYQTSTTSAATWHAGTPTALQGKWQQKSSNHDGNHAYYNKVSLLRNHWKRRISVACPIYLPISNGTK